MVINIFELIIQDVLDNPMDEKVIYIFKKLELSRVIYEEYDTNLNKATTEVQLSNDETNSLMIFLCKWCEKNKDYAGLSTLLNFRKKVDLSIVAINAIEDLANTLLN